jgi:hypothetical protein
MSMLFVDLGDRPRPVEPTLDRLAMARALVSHARLHFDFFQSHTDRLLAERSPESGVVTIRIVRAAALPPGNEFALEMELKHSVEDLRSALEYAAMEVYERWCCGRDLGAEPHVHRNVTFPIPELGSSREAYSAKVDSIFAGLRAARSNVFDLIVAFHRFAGENVVWLDTIHSAWSEVKHRRLGRSEKPMKVMIPGMDLAAAPSVQIFYFPGTTRAVDPNLSAAIKEIGEFLASLASASENHPAAVAARPS